MKRFFFSLFKIKFKSTLTELHWMFTIIPTQNARKCVACNWPLLARERDYFRLIRRTKKDRRRRHTRSVFRRVHITGLKSSTFFRGKLLPTQKKKKYFKCIYEHSYSVVFIVHSSSVHMISSVRFEIYRKLSNRGLKQNRYIRKSRKVTKKKQHNTNVDYKLF